MCAYYGVPPFFRFVFCPSPPFIFRPMRRFFSFASALFGLLLFSGCSHYRLGTGVERDFESIFVPPVETNAAYPQASAVLTTQLREAFIRDGRLRVVNSRDEADAVLTVKLERLSRARLTSLPTDSGLARTMGLTLDATATLQDPKGVKIWFADRKISVARQLFTEDGSGPASATFLKPVQQTQAEYQALPQLAEPFADQLKGAVLDTW
jgi:outer membrane lipopolysaccharide assembly protein LptE/RlpB